VERRFSSDDRGLCQRREYVPYDRLENPSVPEKSGDRDRAAALQRHPLPRMAFEVGPIRGGPRYVELSKAPIEALAHDPSDLPEAGPTKSKLRERPLK
jgi:hypothetical protein